MARWQGVQAAALAVFGLAVVGFVGRQVGRDEFAVIALSSALVMGAAAWFLERNERHFEAQFAQLLEGFDKLKGSRGR